MAGVWHVVVCDVLHNEAGVDGVWFCRGREGAQRTNQTHPPLVARDTLISRPCFSDKCVAFLKWEKITFEFTVKIRLKINPYLLKHQ